MKTPYQLPVYFDSHPLPMVLYDVRDLSIVEVNKAAVKSFGYTKRFLTSQEITQLINDIDANYLKLKLGKTKKKVGVFINTKSKREHLDLYLHPISAKSGNYALAEFHANSTNNIEHPAAYDLQFKQAVESSSIVSIADVRGNITFVNENFVRISGYSEQELLGKNHHLINSGYHPKSFWTAMWKTISKGENWRAEVKNKAKNGTYYWVDTFIMPLVDEKRRITEFLSIRNDITKRKAEEENNKLIAERLSETMQFARMGTAELNLETNSLELSSELLELLQEDDTNVRSVLLDDFLSQYIVLEDIPIIYEKIAAGIEQVTTGPDDFVLNVEFRLNTAKGKLLYIDAQGRFRKNGMALGILRDITIKRLAQKEMLAKAKQIEMMLGGITDGFFATDKLLNFTMISPIFAAMAKMEVEEMLDKNMLELFPFMKGGDLVNTYLEVLQTQKSVQLEHRNPANHNQIFNINIYPNPEGLFIYYHDISVSKQAELELRDTYELFKRLSANVPGMIYNFYLTADLEPVFPYVSSGCEKLFGIDRKELMKNGSLLFDFIHHDDLSGVKASIISAFESNEPWAYEFRVINGNGDIKWIGGNSNPYIERDGSNYWYGFMQDITQRKLDELRIAESELKNRLIIENSGEGILFTDAMGGVLSANPEACRIFKMTEEEICRTGRGGLVAEDQDNLNRILKQRDEERFFKGEILMRRGNGSVFPSEIASRLFIDPSGALRASILVRDISDRKKSEQVREEILERFEKITNHLPGFIFEYILKPDGQSSFPYASSGIVDIYNFTKEEVLEDGGKIFKSVYPDDLSRIYDTIKISADNLSIWSEEYRVISTNGEIKWVEGYASPDKLSDGSIQWYGYIADVTSRKETEFKLQESQNRLRAFFDSKLDATILLDHNYTILDFNKKAVDKSGLVFNGTPRKNQSILNYILPESSDIFISNFKQALNGVEKEAEVEVSSPEQELSWWLYRHLPIVNAEGKVIGVSFTAANITEKKKLTLEINRLALIASHTSNAVILTDVLGNITWVNEGFERISEFSLGEVMGKKPGSFLQGEETDNATIEKMRAGILSRRGFKVELLNYSKSGRKYWLDIEVLPIKSAKGVVTGFMAVESDITSLKNAIHEMQKSEQALQTFMDHAPMVAFIKDLKGRYSFYNKVYRDFMNDKILKPGYTDYDVFDKDFADWCNQRDQHVASTGEMIQFEHHVKGETFLEYKFPLKDIEDKVIAVGGISINITEKLDAQRKITENEEKLRTITDNLYDGVLYQYIVTAQGDLEGFQYVSNGVKDLLEVAPDELLKNPTLAFSMVHPDDLGGLYQKLELSKTTLAAFELEYRITTPSGKLKWIQARIKPRRLPDGRTMWDGLSLNITARKKLELAVQASEAKLQSIFHTMISGLIVVDVHGEITYANQSATDILTLQSSEIEHRYFSSTLWEQIDENGSPYPTDELPLAKALRDKQPVTNIEHGIIAEDGKIKWLNVNAAPLFDYKENLIGAVASFLDITEKKKVEFDLKSSTNRLKIATKTARMGVWEWNLETDETIYDEMLYDLIGLEPGTPMTFAKFSKYLYDDDRVRIKNEIESAIDKKLEILETTMRIIHASTGDIRHFLVSSSIEYDKKGKAIRMIGVDYDITDREHYQQNLKKIYDELNAVLNASTDATFLLDPDFTVRVFNKSAEVAVQGVYDKLIEVGDNFLDYTPLSLIDDLKANFAKALTGEVIYVEREISFTSTISYWNQIRYLPVYGSDGTIVGVSFNASDISARKKTEQELFQSQRYFESLVNSQSSFLIRTDLEGIYIFANKMFYKKFGYLPDKLIGTNALDTILKIDHEACSLVIEKCIKSPGVVFPVTLRKPNPLGGFFWTEWEFVALQDEQGNPVSIQCVGLDATERMQSKFELERVNNRLMLATHSAEMGIWEWDIQSNTIVWDHQQYEIFGVSDYHEISFKLFMSLIHEDDRTIVEDALNRCLQQNDNFDTLFRIQRLSDGKLRYVKAFGSIELSSSGEQIRMVGVNYDITSQEIANQVIRDSEERFRSMAENVPGAILQYVLSKDGEHSVSFMSSGCINLWEISAEEAMTNSKPLWDAVHPDDVQAMFESVMESAKTMQQWQWQWRIITPSKKMKWLESRGVPKKQPDGSVMWYTVILDTTDRKLAEQELLKSRGEYERLVQMIPVGVYKNVKQADGSSRLLYVSKRWCDLHGLQEHQVLNDSSLVIKNIHTDDLPSFMKIGNEAIKNETDFVWEGRIILNDEVRYLHIESKPEKLSNGDVIWNGIEYDITERKISEIELLKTNRLYSVTSQINQMVLHAKTKEEVFAEVCNIAIEYGKFRMAWVGLLDHNAVVKPVAWEGHVDNYFDIIPSISAKDIPEGRGPTGTAARTGFPQINNNIAGSKNASYNLWREEALKRGYQSSIGLPIIINDVVTGVLTLYKEEPNFFTDKEIDLLQEVTSNIAFAIHTIDSENDRKNKEIALLESEVRFRSMIRHLTIGVLLQGPKAEILSSNQAGLEMLGLTEDQLIGKTSFDPDWALLKENGDPFPPDELPVPIAIKTKKPVKGVIMGVMRPTLGDRVWLMVDVIPRMDKHKNVMYVIATLNNITELKATEQLMAESRERIRVISDNLPSVAIYQYELLEGEDEGRYIYFSSGIEGITGLKVEQLLADPSLFDANIHPDDQEHNNRMIAEVNANLSVFDIEYRFRQQNGLWRWFRRRSNPSKVGDGRILWNGVIIDITDQKQAELQLIDALKEKDLLIKEIHHRVKNNLQLISSIIFIKMAGMESSESRGFLENMRQRIRSVALIHERLLQTGSINQVNIADYLKKLIHDLQVSMVQPDSRIEVFTQVQSTEISLDNAIHCGLIVNELVVNAFKHAFINRDGGKIEVTFMKSDFACSLIVKDNGVSLPENIQPGLHGSFGMELLEIFIKQLKANLVIERENGTCFFISFEIDG
ncbi:hypothetical protein SanaruYs_25820 [Chryseotalea sanaruensis]|uniref:histidine kinase n=1 Tax=Chryseotalea sanaruensis TaxID=2482724 RepID=A0A401UBU7_9BACT|nr:PAS domain S-box protein [Chryseotalea sanaruensis]GCC52345.1 hypothetical protein SanaruYs_25820 [Chryseotalea sanaruensis]